MLEEILKFLNITPAHKYPDRYLQVVEALTIRAGSAELSGQSFGIIIDEADHIVRRREILETLRDLSDELEIPFILVGMGRIRTSLTRFPQVASRVGKYVNFADNDATDTKAFAVGLLEVSIEDDLLAFLHQVSKGRVREILEGLKSIETFAGRNNLTAVELGDMAGQKLMNDRATGQEIKVRKS